MRALGIDVGVSKGLDLVLLNEALQVERLRRLVRPAELPLICEQWKPDVVAVDSPPSWGIYGKSRVAEQALCRLGMACFATPSNPQKQKSRFYDWMRVGFQVFRVLDHSYPLFKEGPIRHTAIEVFPYASAVFLSGLLRPRTVSKIEWRRAILRKRGVEVGSLHSLDQIDAALAALTGLQALGGDYSVLGDPTEGVMVIPTRRIPPSFPKNKEVSNAFFDSRHRAMNGSLLSRLFDKKTLKSSPKK